MNDSVKRALQAHPSERQLNWHKTGYYGLISYGIPTFNMKEYGDGCAPASMFCPENPEMNTDEWAELAVSAAMNGLVLNVKQCDGFCLWQTGATGYSVKDSNWLDGEGDLVKMLSDSCAKYGLKFGIQLSLWDRHDKRYGTGDKYDDFVCDMLKELLTWYGKIFYIRLDPTVGADEYRTQKYDYGRYFALIRKLQPEAVIAFAGPDVRWCGNERADFRDAEWACLPAYHGIYEDGTEVKASGRRPVSLISEDLGSEKAIKGEDKFIWYPADLCFPMRSHWYYNDEDKYSVKTKDKLLKAYYGSAGNNGCMMLGIAPDRQGQFADTDTQILKAFGRELNLVFGYNLLNKGFNVMTNSSAPGHDINNVTVQDESYWSPDEKDKKPAIFIYNPAEEPFDKIVIMENITNGQGIYGFEILTEDKNGRMKKIYTGKTVGYKKICPISATVTKKIMIRFTDYRKTPEINYVSVN